LDRNRIVDLMAELSVARSEGFQALYGRWRIFAKWWVSELRAAVPSAWLTRIDGHASPRLLFWLDRDLVVCRLFSAAAPLETRIPLRDFGPAAITTWLSERGLERDKVIAGPVLDPELFFQRNLTLPKAALAALPRILEQDVIRRTPFQLADIWHAAVQAGDDVAQSNVLAMRHWIIRKDRAGTVLAELGLNANDVDLLAIRDENGEPVPIISFRSTAIEDPPWVRRTLKILAAASVAVVILGLVAFSWCQSSVANSIEASLDEARAGALGNSGHGGEAARLFAMKADVGMLDIWDELSRILPDHTFLTEARIHDGRVVISGFSADAARLVRLIDQSPLFTGAALAAAIIPDATEHKERFSISFRIRGGKLPPVGGLRRD
jgi:general secretion pathway protein L